MNASSPAGTGAEAAPMNFAQRLAGIYFEPKNTFEDIRRRSSWVGIFILLSALALASQYVLTSRMDHETFMRKALQMNPMTKSMPEEQIQQVLARPQSAFQKYSAYVFAPLGILVTYLVIAGIFLAAFTLMGASIPYRKSLATTFWGMAPPGILLTLLGILMMYIKDPAELSLNPADNIVTNLGRLVSDKEHPVLASLLGSIDLFSLWTIALLAVGFATVSDGKLTTRRAAVGVVVVWGLWVLGKAGFHAMFG